MQAIARPGVLESGIASWWPCSYSVSQSSTTLLYASGGIQPETINSWDLHRESCVRCLPVKPKEASSNSPIVLALSASKDQPLVSAACSDGSVQILDLREPWGAAIHFPDVKSDAASSSLASIALRTHEARLVTAATGGMMRLWDLRVPSQPQRSIQAHSPSSGLTTLASHPHAPLLATATRTHSLKVWTSSGEQVGALRPASGGFMNSGKSGAITCLAFHPYSLNLAAGGDNNVVALYSIDHSPGSR